MKKQQQPYRLNVTLKPYQQSKHPFGKTVVYEQDIRVPGEETAALFAAEEAKRVQKDRAMKRKRTPFVDDNAKALAETGQLAAAPLAERWQKKSDILYRRITAYHRDRPLRGGFTYQDVAAVRYILDPEQREDALNGVAERALETQDVKLQRMVVKAGLVYKINEPLNKLYTIMSAGDLLRFLGNKAAVSDKDEMTEPATIDQFKRLSVKIDKLGVGNRAKAYDAMASIFPYPDGVKTLRDEARKLHAEKNPRKPRTVSAYDPTAAVDALAADLKNATGAADDARDMALLERFDAIENDIAFWGNGLAQSKAFEALAHLHPNKVTAAYYYDRAVETAIGIDGAKTKGRRLRVLRDNAPDTAKRLETHKVFADNAPFIMLVTDAVDLTKKRAENYDLIRTSHASITARKNDTLTNKMTYQDHKSALFKGTLGSLMKW